MVRSGVKGFFLSLSSDNSLSKYFNFFLAHFQYLQKYFTLLIPDTILKFPINSDNAFLSNSIVKSSWGGTDLSKLGRGTIALRQAFLSKPVFSTVRQN